MSWETLLRKFEVFNIFSKDFFINMDWRYRKSSSVRNKLQFNLEKLRKSKTLQKKLPRFKGTDDEKIWEIERWVKNNITYMKDDDRWNTPDLWQDFDTTLKLKTGDCFAHYESIYTPNGIKKISELKIDDLVLSYDFKKKRYVNKKIINHWKKGKLQVNRVHFRNGTYIDVSENHPMWHRIKKNKSLYEKKELSKIDLTDWRERKVPVVKKLPYIPKDIKWINEDICFIVGHFLAEGWVDKTGKVGTCGYDVYQEVIPKLERNNIPFTEGKNGNGVPTINFLKGEFKDFLKTFKGEKSMSFSAQIPRDILNLPQKKLNKIIEGYFCGDGHYANYKDKRGHNNNQKYILSTSSEFLAKNFQEIGLKLGTPYYIYKQTNHGGAGKKPIWRIHYNTNSYFSKNYGYKDISEVSISHIEKLGRVEMYDLTVEDTHTVIMSNGVIIHQCEDGAILTFVMAHYNRIPAYKPVLCAGKVVGGGHCWVEFQDDNATNAKLIDWCYYTTRKKIKNRVLAKDDKRYLTRWFRIATL